MAKKIFISAGHTNVAGLDRGAFGNGYYEGELTVEFRDLLVAELKTMGVIPMVDDNKNALAKTLLFFKTLVSVDSINIDIHFNASANATATGVEVLIKDLNKTESRVIANALGLIISNNLDIRNRGTKTEAQSARGKLGWFTLTGTNVLIEMCFISNPQDVKNYHANKVLLAKKIANYLKSIV